MVALVGCVRWLRSAARHPHRSRRRIHLTCTLTPNNECLLSAHRHADFRRASSSKNGEEAGDV
jgi:hypothetical protein